MTERQQPWFAGAWRRESITVPGADPDEPCEAWWVQGVEWFIDVRRPFAGREDNELPYSSRRVFAGRFRLGDRPEWDVVIDGGGEAPRLDRGDPGGLFPHPTRPGVIIEDAANRFLEVWVNASPGEQAEEAIGADPATEGLSIRVGAITAVVWRHQDIWHGRISKTGEEAPIVEV